MVVSDVDDKILQYRGELLAEAEMAKDDLDEIEDHLRELLAAGAAFDDAIAQLGAAREVAREHARVRSAFGPRISRLRAWSAAALQVPGLAIAAYSAATDSVMMLLPFALCFVATVGLLARRASAAAYVTGVSTSAVLAGIAALSKTHGREVDVWWALRVMSMVGSVAFLAPRRLRDLTARGWSVLFLGVASTGVVTNSIFTRNVIESSYSITVPVIGIAASVGTLLGLVGVLARGRWARPALLLGTLAMAASIQSFSGAPAWFISVYASSAAALAAAALLARAPRAVRS